MHSVSATGFLFYCLVWWLRERESALVYSRRNGDGWEVVSRKEKKRMCWCMCMLVHIPEQTSGNLMWLKLTCMAHEKESTFVHSGSHLKQKTSLEGTLLGGGWLCFSVVAVWGLRKTKKCLEKVSLNVSCESNITDSTCRLPEFIRLDRIHQACQDSSGMLDFTRYARIRYYIQLICIAGDTHVDPSLPAVSLSVWKNASSAHLGWLYSLPLILSLITAHA